MKDVLIDAKSFQRPWPAVFGNMKLDIKRVHFQLFFVGLEILSQSHVKRYPGYLLAM